MKSTMPAYLVSKRSTRKIFEGRRYDLGDKLGFLQATVDAALKKQELRDEFLKYLNQVCEKENSER